MYHSALRHSALGVTLLVASVCTFGSPLMAQDITYVPGDFSTIQGAIDSSSSGDTIFVASGTYVENINYGGKVITVEGFGPTRPVIEGTGSGSVVTFTSGENSQTVLRWFEITGGSANDGGGINVIGADPLIDRCLIRGNSAMAQGGGASFVTSGSVVSQCVFVDNTVQSAGGGVYCFGTPKPIFLHCTVVDNCSVAGNIGGVSHVPGFGLFLYNCLIYGNEAQLSASNPNIREAASTMAFNCLIEGSYVGGGANNIDGDPQFVDADAGNYRLGVGSAAIDAGDTDVIETTPTYIDRVGMTDFDGNPRFVDDLATADTGVAGPTFDPVDIGAFEREAFSCGWTPELLPLPGLEGTVRDALVILGTGSDTILCVGDIDFGGTSAVDTDLYRFDGRSWEPNPAEIGGTVNCIAFYEGDLYLGGENITVNGMNLGSLISSPDDGVSWFSVGAPPNGVVNDLFVYEVNSGPQFFGSATLWVGGDFTMAGGISASNIAGFDGGGYFALGSGVNGPVEVLGETLTPGHLGVGGTFTTAGGFSANNIARWDSVDWHAFGTGVDGTVRALALYDDGLGLDLYVGGDFMNAGGSPAVHLANWSGSTWSSFGAQNLNNPVHTFQVYDAGTGKDELYIGGAFTLLGAAFVGGVVRFDGTNLSGFPPTVVTPVRYLTTADFGPGEQLVVCGLFTLAGGTAARSVALYDGSSWAPTVPGFNGPPDAMAVFDDGSGEALYMGGGFAGVFGDDTKGILKWDGNAFSSVGTGGTTSSIRIRALHVFDDGMGGGEQLYAGGTMTQIQQVAVDDIARWNGSVWSPVGAGLNAQVRALDDYDAGSGAQLYAGGTFAGGVSVWDGVTWSTVGGGIDAEVYALATYDDGSGEKLYAAGCFSMAGGVAAANIACWDGVQWSALGTGLTEHANALAVYQEAGASSSGLFVGGGMTMAGGVSVNELAIWRDGMWVAPANAMLPLQGTEAIALHVHDEGQGDVLFIGRGSSQSIAFRYDGNELYEMAPGSSDGSMRAFASFNDAAGNSLYAAGGFATLPDGQGGVVSAARFSRWLGPPLEIEMPVGETFCDGGGLTITPILNRPGLAFQWRKDGMDLPGQTQETLLIPSASVNDTGDYSVVVTTLCDQMTSTVTSATIGPCDFIRGDVDANGALQIMDAIDALGYLLLGQSVDCEKSVDTNDDGVVTITDPFAVLCFLFCAGSPPPAAPYPMCGPDVGSDGLTCDVQPVGCP